MWLLTLSLQVVDFIGGADEDRTRDLLTASQALSQLSYSPTRRKLAIFTPFFIGNFC